MNCILHIGTEKTGTTTLQEFFHQNRGRLFDQGILYTKSAGLRNNRGLSAAAYNRSRRDDYTKNHGLDNDNALLSHQTHLIEKLRDELKHQKDSHTVVFSSEHIQSRLTSNEEVSRLKRILDDLQFTNIEVVVYLRAPQQIANSLYTTAVQNGATYAEPPPPSDPYWNNVCHHQNTLERFANHFGKEAIFPRVFSKTHLIEGSIVNDFMTSFLPDISLDLMKLPKEQNTSMNKLGLELLRRINQKIPPYTPNGIPSVDRTKILQVVINRFSFGQKYKMPEALFKLYEREFSASNEWVRQHFFPEVDNLFYDSKDKKPENGEESKYTEAELDNLTEMLVELYQYKTPLIKSWRKRLALVSVKLWRSRIQPMISKVPKE